VGTASESRPSACRPSACRPSGCRRVAGGLDRYGHGFSLRGGVVGSSLRGYSSAPARMVRSCLAFVCGGSCSNSNSRRRAHSEQAIYAMVFMAAHSGHSLRFRVMSARDSTWARVPRGQNILALRHIRTHLLALRHPSRQPFGLVAPQARTRYWPRGSHSQNGGRAKGGPRPRVPEGGPRSRAPEGRGSRGGRKAGGSRGCRRAGRGRGCRRAGVAGAGGRAEGAGGREGAASAGRLVGS
jgi:hypothetical protein